MGFGLPIPGIEHIEQPYWFRLGGGLAPDEFGLRVARQLEERISALGAYQVAAFIAEPIQGAGGVIIPPDSYWPEIQRICKAHTMKQVSITQRDCIYCRKSNAIVQTD